MTYSGNQAADNYRDFLDSQSEKSERLRQMNKPYYTERLEQVMAQMFITPDYISDALADSKHEPLIRAAMDDMCELGRLTKQFIDMHLRNEAEWFVGASAESINIDGEYEEFIEKHNLPFIGER